VGRAGLRTESSTSMKNEGSTEGPKIILHSPVLSFDHFDTFHFSFPTAEDGRTYCMKRS
jgi:hypothetical protein